MHRLPSTAKALLVLLGIATQVLVAADSPQAPSEAYGFLENHCLDCHDDSELKGGLNLDTLAFDLENPENFAQWVLVHDRADHGEMPPKKKRRPNPEELSSFLAAIAAPLEKTDLQRIKQNGRSKVRRLNRYEYENTLRHLLDAPWLHVANSLPEDGIDHLYNKVGERLDVSHVQMSRYLDTADYALRAAITAAAFPSETKKYYAREEPGMIRYMPFRFGNKAATRSSTPLLDYETQPEVIRGNQPTSVGESNPELREREAFGFVSGTYTATTKYDFNRMQIPVNGRYKIRLKSYTYMAGPNGSSKGDDHGLTGGEQAWWRPDRNVAMPGKRSEPITLYALAESGESRWLATYDAFPKPHVTEHEIVLKKGEGIRPDAGRLVRTRPGWKGNPNATREGIPGFALNWLEVEGPLTEQWPPESYQALFQEMPFDVTEDSSVRVQSKEPLTDAKRLLRSFMQKTYRRDRITKSELAPFLAIYQKARSFEQDFTDSMISAYTSVLCSTDFLYLESQAGRLENTELATRLSYFLWNGSPDDALLETKNLSRKTTLRSQVERLLEDPKSERFINAFLDYWLDLREINANTPDADLYPEYYLDDQLTEASLFETRLFFRDLLDNDLPVRNLIDSDFTYVNERLAQHYGLPSSEGVKLKRVDLPSDSPRGGIFTQASVLRVTANGTTTSPVVRGAWVMERLLGMEIPPPPSGLEAIEPDTRGATTIREQLALHREEPSCHACHAKFDPPGLALESFDVSGGWREWYRATGNVGEEVDGFGKNGHRFIYRNALPADSTGELEDGRTFSNVNELKSYLLTDEKRIARNLAHQFIIYATGAPVSFSDRSEVENILDRSQNSQYGVRTLLHEVTQSDLFKIK